ncbi:hypothetical protein E2C01_068538 [Portunus trituberculatus]|uniref:Uncharacterized protein n=1 Tax=Portunus trituberculatus TaxID=210409 RepID=A0A5B7HZQ4_PORTR|nr:hypothetical protein [Portunus trituberculatus]
MEKPGWVTNRRPSLRISELETNIKEQTRILEFSQAEFGDQQGTVRTLQKSEIDLKSIILELETSVENLKQRVNYQEDYNRRKNIRITGLSESRNGDTWEQTVIEVSTLLQNKLQLPPMKIERAHRLVVARHGGQEGQRLLVPLLRVVPVLVYAMVLLAVLMW